MYKWILPTISEILTQSESNLVCHSQAHVNSHVHAPNVNILKRARVEREWRGAIASVEQLLLETIAATGKAVGDGSHTCLGLVLAGSVPVLSQPALLSSLQTWTFTPEWLKLSAKKPFQLPPATASSATENVTVVVEPLTAPLVALLPGDPLASEQFCLVLTAQFSLVMVAGVDSDGVPAFMFSFDPYVVEQTWHSLRSRVELTSTQSLSQLDSIVEKYYPIAPDYRTVTQFSRLLLKHLPEPEGARDLGLGARGYKRVGGAEEAGEAEGDKPLVTSPQPPASNPCYRPDLELLQAFAHEVRTPLTTIRTLIRLLLKRRDLGNDVRKRLEVIEYECREQIDRMELMFRAVELETSKAKNTNTYLIATSLEQVLQQSIPRWQQSAERRNLTLDVVMPQQMPTVISHPSQLDQVLTGLIENFTRSLPAGSHIQVQVMPAGDQLKLQLFSQSHSEDNGAADSFWVPPIRKSLGQLLTFQPETGSISLNLTATKHLFQAIGGKLIVRQRPHLGEVLTVFLPLEISNQAVS